MLSKYHEKIIIILGWLRGKYRKKCFQYELMRISKFIMFKLGLIFDITMKKIKDKIYSLTKNGSKFNFS